MSEATHLMRYLMKKGVRTILFCKVPVNYWTVFDYLLTVLSLDKKNVRAGKNLDPFRATLS